VYELRPAQVARALDVLRAGPLTAAEFARRVWPERSAARTPGRQAQSGHAVLQQLGKLGYVQRVGEYWMLRTFQQSSAEVTADRSALGAADPLPIQPPVGPPDEQADLLRLHRLVRLADAPVDGVSHDAALGDIAIRGEPLTDCLAEACAYVVLRGRTMNVYLPGEDAEMLVGLSPAEAARALHVRWRQTGVPPEPHNELAWLYGDDGIIADGWSPVGVDLCEWWEREEPLDQRIRRQRQAAGLA
jgi:hypothetical protein